MNNVTGAAQSLVASDGYTQTMKWLMDSVLTGAMARVVTVLLIAMALWFALRREQLGLGFMFIVMAMFLMYGHGVMRWLGML